MHQVLDWMRKVCRAIRYCGAWAVIGWLICWPIQAQSLVEPRIRLASQGSSAPRLALTLDACGGGFDEALYEFLVSERIPATLFVTARWIRRNPEAVVLLKAHAELFQIENHGAHHMPAFVGPQRRVYGIAGVADWTQLQAEVRGGAQAIVSAFGASPRWYRGATALYDPHALQIIERLGYRVAGYTLNADAGATLPGDAIVQRLRRARDGDVIIAHLNKPASGTAAGLAAGLIDLRQRGFVFVRLDQSDWQSLPPIIHHRP